MASYPALNDMRRCPPTFSWQWRWHQVISMSIEATRQEAQQTHVALSRFCRFTRVSVWRAFLRVAGAKAKITRPYLCPRSSVFRHGDAVFKDSIIEQRFVFCDVGVIAMLGVHVEPRNWYVIEASADSTCSTLQQSA